MAVTVQQKTSRRSEIQKLITHRSWRKRGHVAIKARYRQRVAGPRAQAFIRVCGWSALGFLGYVWIGQTTEGGFW